MRTIAILGHFGANKQILDGQTIKTRILYDELKKETDWKIKTVDTYYKNKRPVSLLLKSVACFISTKDIIVLLSGRGMRFYYPILYFFAKVFHNKIYQCTLGGNLDMYIKKYPNFKKYLNSFVVNWTETNHLKVGLEEVGLTNCENLPNFKRLNIASEEETTTVSYCEPYKLCTFSRVMKQKGIEDAVNAVIAVNEAAGRTVFSLDVYGQVDAGEHEWFDRVQQEFPSYVSYGGEVPYSKSTEVLKTYFALLFPTRFYMEGVPGTIIDAYAAGLPVISSQWRSFEDIIVDGVTGIGYEFENVDALISVLNEIKDSPNRMINMKKDCLDEAKKYLPENNVRRIIEKVESK